MSLIGAICEANPLRVRWVRESSAGGALILGITAGATLDVCERLRRFAGRVEDCGDEGTSVEGLDEMTTGGTVLEPRREGGFCLEDVLEGGIVIFSGIGAGGAGAGVTSLGADEGPDLGSTTAIPGSPVVRGAAVARPPRPPLPLPLPRPLPPVPPRPRPLNAEPGSPVLPHLGVDGADDTEPPVGWIR